MAASFSEIRVQARERWQSLSANQTPWIRVGTALCGQAAGAEEVADAIQEELEKQGLNAQVSRVGCLGLCFAEPLVDVLLPGKSRVVYGNVGLDQVPELVASHIGQGQPVADMVLGYLGDEISDDLPNLQQHP